MLRAIDIELEKWKNSRNRKPLLLRGARQVGKTYSARNVGKKFKSFVEVNFEKRKDACSIFSRDFDTGRILRELSILTESRIVPGETLLFFDEIQECPEAVKSLRYFFEDSPDLHVISAGSLIEFSIEKIGLPVGRISMLYLYPVSFSEYLASVEREELISMMAESCSSFQIGESFHARLMSRLGEYMAIGGMPEVLGMWMETKDFPECVKIQNTLIDTYRQDFERYGRKHQIEYLEMIFNRIPSFAGEKFKFAKISGCHRKRELEPALELLEKAGLVHRIRHTHANGLPLGAEADFEKYKVIFLDVGLSNSIMNMSAKGWILTPLEELVNRGGMAEAFVGQELLAYSDPNVRAQLFYWHREARSSNAEVDYIIANGSKIVPVEVKSGAAGSLRSMGVFLDEHSKSRFGIRFFSGIPAKDKNVLSYPLYAIKPALESL
ncbi:MAG: AAA family ATPase [Victivallales bacterium]